MYPSQITSPELPSPTRGSHYSDLGVNHSHSFLRSTSKAQVLSSFKILSLALKFLYLVTTIYKSYFGVPRSPLTIGSCLTQQARGSGDGLVAFPASPESQSSRGMCKKTLRWLSSESVLWSVLPDVCR